MKYKIFRAQTKTESGELIPAEQFEYVEMLLSGRYSFSLDNKESAREFIAELQANDGTGYYKAFSESEIKNAMKTAETTKSEEPTDNQ